MLDDDVTSEESDGLFGRRVTLASSALVPSSGEVWSQGNVGPREAGRLRGSLTNGVYMWLIPLPFISLIRVCIPFLFLFPLSSSFTCR